MKRHNISKIEIEEHLNAEFKYDSIKEMKKASDEIEKKLQQYNKENQVSLREVGTKIFGPGTAF